MGIYRGAGGTGDAVNDASSEASLVQTLVNDATTQATNAATSATAAQAAATQANISKGLAEDSATAAAASETNAASSETAAETAQAAAEAAQLAAETAETNAETAETNAETAQAAAATSATNAASSASSASTSATNASNSASSASTSATNAANSATAAATSATNAASSATSASGSASTATTQASNASTSATNAASSATSAAGSATTATTQAGIATTKASEASTSATNAASSASAASTSASNAATSATNAATSATSSANSASASAAARDAALAALDSFDDRYLGTKSSDPTLDNDGNALVAGALYFNTVDNAMKVYDGSVWLAAYASLAGALLSANNLSDVSNAASARTNLGLVIGTDVQAYDADLTAFAGKTAPSGTVVGTSDSQTLTNKTLALGSNTVSGTLAQFNTAVTDADFASLAGTETLSNKTLAGVTNTGNLTFTGTGNRITGDFSNATVANRVAIQSSTTNGQTVVGIIPNGTSTATQLQLFSSPDYTNYSRIAIQNTGSAINFLSDYAGTGSYLPVTFTTGGSERLRIDTSGNVGIGTSAATSKLSFGANIGLDFAVFENAGGSNKYGIGMSGAGTGGDPYRTKLYANGAEYLSITSGGNVGIGTSSPTSKLHIAGSNVQLRFTNGAGTPHTRHIAVVDSDNTMRFTRTGVADDLVIDSSGKVGIGTASPLALVHVGDGSNAIAMTGVSPVLAVKGASFSTGLVVGRDGYAEVGFRASGSGEIGTWNNFAAVFVTNASERMRIDTSGNVGIGTSSPAGYSGAKLLNIYGTGSSVGQLILEGGTGTNFLTAYSGINSTDLPAIYFNQGLRFGTATSKDATGFTERMRIDSSGNVGIGTSSPTAKLHTVHASTDNVFMMDTVAAGTSSYITFKNTGATYGYAGLEDSSGTTFATGGANALVLMTSTTNPIILGTNNTQRLFIDSSGNVGIGTSSPIARFQVAGGDSILCPDGNVAGFGGTTTNAIFKASGTDALVFRSNSAERMRIDSNGIVTGTAGNLMLVSDTAKATTSGTSKDFTGIPSWVKRITVMFSGVSTSGTSNILIQLGDSGGIETTSYRSVQSNTSNTTANTAIAYTNGFNILVGSAGAVISGNVTICLITGTTWTFSSLVSDQTQPRTMFGAGDKSLSDVLTQVRITTANGTDTFDAGNVNIFYE